MEFADFRHYVHGDDLRFVDWNIYGRLDRLFMKIFLEEEDLSLMIAVDTSASMDWGIRTSSSTREGSRWPSATSALSTATGSPLLVRRDRGAPATLEHEGTPPHPRDG